MSKVFDVSILNKVVESANTTTQYVFNQIDILTDSDVEAATKIITRIMAVLQELYKTTGFQESEYTLVVKTYIQQIGETMENRPDKAYENLTKLPGFNLVNSSIKVDYLLKEASYNLMSNNLSTKLKTIKKPARSPKLTEQELMSDMYSKIKVELITEKLHKNPGFNKAFVCNAVQHAWLSADTQKKRWTLLCFDHLQRAELASKNVNQARDGAGYDPQTFAKMRADRNAEFILASYYIKLMANPQSRLTSKQ